MTLQLPTLGTSALLITRSFIAMVCIGYPNTIFRQSSPGESNYSSRLSLTRTIFYRHLVKIHLQAHYFTKLLHENPLYQRWANLRKGFVTENIRKFFMALITTLQYLWLVCFNLSIGSLEAHILRAFLKHGERKNIQ